MGGVSHCLLKSIFKSEIKFVSSAHCALGRQSLNGFLKINFQVMNTIIVESFRALIKIIILWKFNNYHHSRFSDWKTDTV